MEERKRIPSEFVYMVLEVEKARTELGWVPRVRLQDGIGLDWLKINPDAW